jgi:hypothetical protein
MTAMSNYLENVLINATLRGQTYTAPTTVYLALYTSNPTDSATGTEVVDGGYVRQIISFGIPSNGATSNGSDVIFPIATASWGTVTHIAIFDAQTAGNLLYYGALTASKTIASGDQLRVAAGDITVTLA